MFRLSPLEANNKERPSRQRQPGVTHFMFLGQSVDDGRQDPLTSLRFKSLPQS